MKTYFNTLNFCIELWMCLDHMQLYLMNDIPQLNKRLEIEITIFYL